MSIEQLKRRWYKDKAHFEKKEVGELQDFVKDMFQDEEVFGLKKGLGTTERAKRKYEFTMETGKKGRRADYTIYIDADITIPVEVEKYKNIKAGVQQLYQYQKDWNKKFGILTDGEEWRFYRSNHYQTFKIDDIFRDIARFKVYWKDYIKPENYYIELFNPSGQKGTSREQLDLNIPENRVAFFDDITSIAKNFMYKMRNANKGFSDFLKGDEKATEITYSYLIQFILYKVLVDNGFKKFEQEYKSTFGKISKAINDKDFYSLITQEIMKISNYISTNIYKPFASEQEEISEKLAINLKTESTLEDVSPWLDIILFIDRYSFAGLKNEIFGFIYENFLKEEALKKKYGGEKKGQYFTDPAVVNFMLEEMGYTEEEVKKRAGENKVSLIDVSCGAGTFLYSAVDKIVSAFEGKTEEESKYIEKLVDENIFGLDIEEFPLYLAEVNILMRLLPLIVNDDFENPIDNKLKIFKTKDSISEFLDIGLDKKIEDKEQPPLFEHFKETSLDYPSFMRSEKDLKEMLESLQQSSMRTRTRFDYVIGNPPYLGYNECCRQKIEFTKKMKDKTDDTFSFANVYGLNLHSVEGYRKKRPPKPNLYAFFIALGLALLKENGILCYVVPQTMLHAGDLDVLRYHFSNYVTIDKIIILPEKLFTDRGLKQDSSVSTSSLVFVVKKKFPDKENKVQIVNYSKYVGKEKIDFNKYLNFRNSQQYEIEQSTLSKNVSNWNFLKWSQKLINFYNRYKKNAQSLEVYYNHKLSKHSFDSKFYFDIGYNIDEKKILKEKSVYIYPKLDYSLFSVKKGIGYWDNNREDKRHPRFIELLKANQKYSLLDSKYKIIWRYQNPKRFFFTDKPLIWARNQYNAIGSSHLAEIHYLFSLLNSKINTSIFNKAFKSENEKDLLISLMGIKNLIRIPIITDKNQFIKDEIIKQTEKLLSLEDFQLKDFVDFNTTQQRFKSIAVKGNKLLLTNTKDHVIEQNIKSKPKLVKKLIEKNYRQDSPSEITLKELKFMEVVDSDEQVAIKNYIDDLVFALYFDVSVKTVGLNNSEKIKSLCRENKFYDYVQEKS